MQLSDRESILLVINYPRFAVPTFLLGLPASFFFVATVAIGLAASIAIGSLFYIMIELPALLLRRSISLIDYSGLA